MNLFSIKGRRRMVMRSALVLLSALGGGKAFCQVPAAALPPPGGAGTSVALGTLILSPSQRRHLEAVRNAPGGIEAATQPVPDGQTRDLMSGLPGSLAVSGFVIRSGNRSTVWINEQALYGRAPPDSLRTLAGQAGVLQPGTADVRTKARPGQVIDVPSGQTVDLLPPGAIRIIPPKATGRDFPKE
jgi:hypothetical protein